MKGQHAFLTTGAASATTAVIVVAAVVTGGIRRRHNKSNVFPLLIVRHGSKSYFVCNRSEA
jgi:hypothetical protein